MQGNDKLSLRVLFAVSLGVAIVGSGGCKRGGDSPDGKSESKLTAASAKPATQVGMTTVAATTIEDVILVTGALSTKSDVTVGVKSSGRLQSVFVREGDVVHAGQIVAKQDPIDLQAQLDSQRANLAANLSRLEQAKVAQRNSLVTLKWTDEQTNSAVRQSSAALEIAKQQSALVQAGARPQERQQAEENVLAAKADRDKARSDLKRYQNLYRQNAISAQQLDQAQSIADSAEARYNSAMQAASLVKEGARVEDIRRAIAAVEQANQAVVSAQSNREQVNMRRADVENARAGIMAAQAAVLQARASVRLAEQALRDLDLRSPIEGIVQARLAEPGTQVSNAKPDVLRIVDVRSIYFDAPIPETQYSQLSVGQTVQIEVYAMQGRKFTGAIAQIFPVASAARSFTARVVLKNDGNLLRPAMFASGKVLLSTHKGAVVVSRDTIMDKTGNKGRVFVVKNGVAEERKVTLGIQNGDKTEVVEGLQTGDRVISSGQGQIQKGDKVEDSHEDTKTTL